MYKKGSKLKVLNFAVLNFFGIQNFTMISAILTRNYH